MRQHVNHWTACVGCEGRGVGGKGKEKERGITWSGGKTARIYSIGLRIYI